MADRVSKASGDGWCILERLHWLSPAQTPEATTLLNMQQLESQIHYHCVELKKPLLIAAMQEFNGVWKSRNVYLYVPNDWPK